MLSALIFATIENLLYLNVYVPTTASAKLEALAQFRWRVCTTLHVTCALVASLGVAQAWKQQLRDGQPVQLSIAYPYFVTAIAMHGVYNFIALNLGDLFE